MLSIKDRFGEQVHDLANLSILSAATGAVAGAVAGGLGSRIAMRIVGITSSNIERLNRTENDAVVGDITLGGTLALVIVGAILGILGGFFYVALRPWLPKKWPLGGLIFGVLLLVLAGGTVIDSENRDFRIFGDKLINVLLFALLFPLFGLLLAYLVARFDGRVGPGINNFYLQLALIAVLIVLYLLAILPSIVTFIDNPGGDALTRAQSWAFISVLGLTGMGMLTQVLASDRGYRAQGLVLVGCAVLVGLYYDLQVVSDIL